MTEQAFLVLTALADQPRHGYGIVREVGSATNGRVRLRVGTLYGVLDRLSADGLIELDREEPYEGRLRRYYRLTDSGAVALTVEAERLAERAAQARERLKSRLTGPVGDGGAEVTGRFA